MIEERIGNLMDRVQRLAKKGKTVVLHEVRLAAVKERIDNMNLHLDEIERQIEEHESID